MSDPRNPGGPSGDDPHTAGTNPGASIDEEDDLADVLASVDKAFDELEKWGTEHDADEPEQTRTGVHDMGTPPAAGAAAPPAEPDTDEGELGFDELEFMGEPEALGSLLGAPPPLPPVEEDRKPTPKLPASRPTSRPPPPRSPSDDGLPFVEDKSDDGLMTSASRPSLAPAPTDEELFGDLPEAVPEPEATHKTGPRDAHTESTRVADLDQLESLARGEGAPESTRVVGPDEALLAELARDDKPETSRGPAIVRREDLERKRRAESEASDFGSDFGNDFEDYPGGEATRVADLAQLESLAQNAEAEAAAAAAAAEAFFGDEPPEVELEVDTEFYDDIEIGGPAEGDDAPPEPIAPVKTGRRMAHTVRRDTLIPPLERAEAEGAVVMEIEAEPSDVYEIEDPAGNAPSLEVQGEIGARPPYEHEQPPISGELDAIPEPIDVPEKSAEAEAAALADAEQAERAAAEEAAEADEPALFDDAPFDDLFEQEAPAAVAATPVPLEEEPEPEPAGPPPEAVGPAIEAALDEADVAPELPPSKYADREPALDFEALALPDEVAPEVPDRSEELAAQLLVYERELELLDEPAQLARVRLEAARLAEQLGDLERARTHYDEALAADPRRVSALRGLRRVARAAGAWDEAVRHLDHELTHASQLEKRALAAHRADLLVASGEQDLARVAVGDLLDEAPTDPRALLLELELALVDGREEELDSGLARLTAAVQDSAFAASLALARGRWHEARRDREAAAAAYETAAERAPASRAARVGLARVRRERDPDGACEVLAALADTPLAQAAPHLAAAHAWRAAIAGDGEAAWNAIVAAAGLVPEDPVVIGDLAAQCERRGDAERAVQALARLTEIAPSAAESAEARARCGRWLAEAGRADDALEVLRGALSVDPGNAEAALRLERALLAQGDQDALSELDRHAAEADPTAVFERLRLADRLAAAGRHDEAADALLAGRAAGARSPALDRALIKALARAERREERAVLLAQCAAAGGDDIDAERAAVEAARAAEELAHGAAAVLDAATGFEGDEPATDIDALRDARDRAVTTAIDAWQRVLDSDAESTEAHAATIRLAELLGHPDVIEDALARAQSSMTYLPRAVSLALRRARAVLGQADPDTGRAEEILREIHDAAPEEPRTAAALVAVAAMRESWADAALVLEERAGGTGEREALALRYRAAGIYLDRAGDPARAAELLVPVVEAAPRLTPARDMLGAARRRAGDAGPALDAGVAAERGRAAASDSFARLVREAETCADDLHDPGRAVDLFQQAMTLRPADPLAREGFTRAATAAGEAAALAELALGDLKAAEELGDGRAKADAYEELARIDTELRGDAASALLGYESALRADPTRLPVLRKLEHAYVRDERGSDLLGLYDIAIEAVRGTADVAPLAMARARLAEEQGRAPDEIAASYARALEADPRRRMALFHLEARSRGEGFSAELAELEEKVAELFVTDDRARAAFLARAGETHMELGDLETAIERFRTAYEIATYAPALSGWREAALRGQLWIDLAEAAQREAEVAGDDAERAALNHLAGVALMDRALNGERAVWALRKVLAADPTHVDAFVRLRLLFDEQGEHEDLAQLLDRRLEVATDNAERAELHRALADVYRNFLEDRDEAKQHLRAVLEIYPADRRAIASLSDIAWEQGAWGEAAEALIGRARLETDPDLLKGIFYRLGTIYAERLPDPRWAIQSFSKVLSYDPEDEGALVHLARLGIETKQWKMALGACERLLTSTEESEDQVVYWHLVGRIYLEGFGDRPRAERAYRTALDLAPANEAALTQLIGFFEQAGDTRSMRVHLDRVAQSMRSRLSRSPVDGLAYRVLARALAAREQAGAPGSRATARCAAELAIMAGGGEEAESRLAAEAVQRPPPIAALASPDIDDLLFPRSVPNAVRQLFGLLGDKIAKQVGVDIRSYGVGRGDRLRNPNDPVFAAVRSAADELGIEGLDVYVSRRHPTIAVAEPAGPIALILGESLANPERPVRLRFAAGRALKLAVSQFAVPARMAVDDFGLLLVGILRQFAPDVPAPPSLDREEVDMHQQRLRRLIPSGMVVTLRPFAINIASTIVDHHKIWAGIHKAGNRAGLLACGSARAAISVLCAQRNVSDLTAAAEDEITGDLMRFAVSDDHARLRAAMGG